MSIRKQHNRKTRLELGMSNQLGISINARIIHEMGILGETKCQSDSDHSQDSFVDWSISSTSFFSVFTFHQQFCYRFPSANRRQHMEVEADQFYHCNNMWNYACNFLRDQQRSFASDLHNYLCLMVDHNVFPQNYVTDASIANIANPNVTRMLFSV